MGIFDFVKSAGEKLGIGRDDEPEAPSAAEQMEARNERMALGMNRMITDRLGLEVEDLAITVDGDLVTVGGKVDSQEIKEKVVLAVGNVRDIARVDDRLEVTGPAAVFYTVVSGDTLSKIAKEHYGDAMKYPTIFEANRPMLEHPDRIYPGQVLRIPPMS